MEARLFADQGNQKVDQVFVAEHRDAGLDEAARVVNRVFVSYFSENKDRDLAVSVDILPLLGSSQVHLLQFVEENSAKCVKKLVFEADFHEPLLIPQARPQLFFRLHKISIILKLLVEQLIPICLHLQEVVMEASLWFNFFLEVHQSFLDFLIFEALFQGLEEVVSKALDPEEADA